MCLPVVFTLTLLPCHTDEPGTKPTFCIAACTTFPLPLLPSNIVALGCGWRIWCPHFPSLPMPLLQLCRSPLTAHFGGTRGSSGIAWCLVPRFCNRKAGAERRHRPCTGGFTASEVTSLPVLLQEMLATSWTDTGRAGLTAQGWDGLYTEQC